MGSFEIRKDGFYKNGERLQLLSGALHYFRILPEYWEDRLKKLKDCGLNTVETYVPWNLHEPHEGEYDFEGNLDIAAFITMAESMGLNVIVRPSPYICAEWEFGGLPAWLLKYPDMVLRCAEESFISRVERYYEKLIPIIAPHQITNDGGVIMLQIENEYGSYGDDKEYLRALAASMRKNGIDVPLFTSDGGSYEFLACGALPEEFKVINYFSTDSSTAFDDLRRLQPDGPLMCGEFWGGWFDHWNEEHCTRSPEDFKQGLESLLSMGASVNLYMFHGGTNFGFMNGANHSERSYKPDVTSYDYDCMLDEQGNPTKKYYITRELIEKYAKLPTNTAVYLTAPSIAYGEIEFTQSATLLSSLDKIAKGPFKTRAIRSCEYFSQNYGITVYKTRVPRVGKAPIIIDEVHDIGLVFADGNYLGTIYRNDEEQTLEYEFVKEETELCIVVYNMGRVNYGRFLHDRKGITENVRVHGRMMFGWEVYTLELDDISALEYQDGIPTEESSLPVFLKAEFDIDEVEDCFLRTDDLGQGQAYINGFNLGRYWTSAGPQRTLWIPKALLREGRNELVVLELRKTARTAELCDKPDLGPVTVL